MPTLDRRPAARVVAAPALSPARWHAMQRSGAGCHPLDSVLSGTGLSLRRLADLVLDGRHGPGSASESDCRAVAAAAAALRQADEERRIALPAHLDTALVAWAAEQLAARRIEDGDLGIDVAARRLAEAEAELGAGGEEARLRWQRARDEYTRLAEILLADCFDDMREFDLCKLFVSDRAAYRAWRDQGRRRLAELAGRLVMTAH